MLNKQPAFKFIGQTKEEVSSKPLTDMTNGISLINSTVNSAVNFLNLFGKVVKNYAEREKTKQVYRQIALKKEMLDKKVKEEKKRADLILAEYQERLENELYHEKKKLKLNLSKIKKEYTALSQKREMESQEYFKRLEIKKRIRKPINFRLKKTKELIELVQESGHDLDLIAELDEQFRLIQRNYNKIIEKLT